MNYTGMLRVRNEAEWIDEVVRSLLPLCGRVFVMDDHSTDNTAEICRAIGNQVIVMPSPFEGLDEARDKDWILEHIRATGGTDIVVAIDGDEVLEPTGQEKIVETVKHSDAPAWAFQVVYLWDGNDQVRTDRLYGAFRRPSMFRLGSVRHGFKRTPYGGGANLHCSSVPGEFLPYFAHANVRLKHYGYRDREKRIEKWRYYNRIDPHNYYEDCYQHVVQGDVPEVPADAQLLHAGPLRLEPISF